MALPASMGLTTWNTLTTNVLPKWYNGNKARDIVSRGTPTLFWLMQNAKREITEAEASLGDVVLFEIGRTYSHAAIIVDPGWPYVIHADLGARAIILARGKDGALASAKSHKFFTLW